MSVLAEPRLLVVADVVGYGSQLFVELEPFADVARLLGRRTERFGLVGDVEAGSVGLDLAGR